MFNKMRGWWLKIIGLLPSAVFICVTAFLFFAPVLLVIFTGVFANEICMVISDETCRHTIIILLIVYLIALAVCGTVIVIATNDSCLKWEKFNILRSVLSGKIVLTDNVYKEFAEIISGV